MVIDKLRELSEKKPMEGQDKYYSRIRNEGLMWNHKRVSRVYRLMGLNKKKRTRRRIPARIKTPLVSPTRPNETWSMDFMHDRLINTISSGLASSCGNRYSTGVIPASDQIHQFPSQSLPALLLPACSPSNAGRRCRNILGS